jgi:hypothetical protein
MKKSLSIFAVAILSIAIGLTFAEPASADDSITFSVDAPHVQGSSVSGAIVENFNANPGTPCPTRLAFGSFTGSCEHPDAIYYAGASSELATPVTGGVGTPFAQVPMGGAMDITLDRPANYLGFHWEAGNEFDRVTLYSGTTLLANFSFQTLMDALNASTLSSNNGTVYQKSDYIHNPVTGVQEEPYAYVHIFATNGAKFDRVVMSEDAGSPGIFEFDNLTVAYAAGNNTQNFVPLQSVQIVSKKPVKLANTGANYSMEIYGAIVLLSLGFVILTANKRRRARG